MYIKCVFQFDLTSENFLSQTRSKNISDLPLDGLLLGSFDSTYYALSNSIFLRIIRVKIEIDLYEIWSQKLIFFERLRTKIRTFSWKKCRSSKSFLVMLTFVGNRVQSWSHLMVRKKDTLLRL